METDRQRIEELAQELVEGDGPDWGEADRPDDPESTRSAIRSLQAVAKLRAFAMDSATRMTESARQPLRDPHETLPATGDPTQSVPARWGHLEPREVLGRGTQGVVYRAWDPELEVHLALKLDREHRIAREEARRLARVRHPHVVRVFGAAEHDGCVGLWMEFVRGRTLAERLAVEGPMSEEEAIDLGVKLAGALAAIHAVNVVHQDVKARNVMREEGGRYVLMDLGCGADLDKQQTEVGGTPYYMAPELLEGSSPDKRADIYSLGVLLFHAVTARFPYEGRSLGEIRERHRSESMKRLRDLRPELSAGFCRVIERALAREPQQRQPSAGELLADLEGLGGSNGLDTPGLWTRFVRRWTARFASLPRVARVSLWAAALVVASAAVIVGIQGLFFGPERLDLELELLRSQDDTSTVLQSGASIEAGDLLHLRLRGTTPCHVYVFGADEEGSLVRLFPLSYSEQQNPLEARNTYELPGTRNGKLLNWEMSSTRGRDRLLVVAAPEPVPEFEGLAQQIVELGGPESDAERDLGSLRGFERTREMPHSAAELKRAEDRYRRLKQLASRIDGAWIREYELVNTGG